MENYYTNNKIVYAKPLFILLLVTLNSQLACALKGATLNSTAHAAEVSLEVYPANLYIEANPPADIRAPFTIKNNSGQSVTLQIGYKLIDADNSQDGKVVYLNNVDPTSESIFRQIQVVDAENVSYDSLELGPKQEKDLQLRFIFPTEQFQNDYYFTLIFLQDTEGIDPNTSKDNEEQQYASTSLQGGIGINTFLALGPKEQPQLTITEFSTSWFRQTGPVSFKIKLANEGLHYTRPQGKIVIKNLFGQTVGIVDLPQRAILADSQRELLTEAEMPISWSNRFILGNYTAELRLTDVNEKMIATQTIRFIAFPLVLLLGLAGIFAGSIYIYRKVKRQTQK